MVYIKENGKKYIALFLVCAMMVGLFPMEAYAADGGLVNGGFEYPYITSSYLWFLYRQIAVEEQANFGWNKTVLESTDFEFGGDWNVTEWGINFIPEGRQFIELNADEQSAIYQDLSTKPGDIFYWSLYQGGVYYTSSPNIDNTMTVRIGTPNELSTREDMIRTTKSEYDQPWTSRTIYEIDSKTVVSSIPSTYYGKDTDKTRLYTEPKRWTKYEGVYVVPEGQTVTRFVFASLSTNPLQGNLLDGVVFRVGTTQEVNTQFVEVAKEAAEKKIYSNITQDVAKDEAAIKDTLKLAVEEAIKDSRVTTTINTVNYIQPIAGTPINPNGENGRYTFTITLSMDEATQTTSQKTTTIIATIYSEELAAAKTTAKGELTTALGTYTETDYSASNWTVLNNAKSAGDIAIDAAADLAGVTAAKNEAQAAMDAVKTRVTTPSKLTAGAVSRTSDTTAMVKFNSNEGGTYYYNMGSAPNTSTGGTAFSAGETTITLTDLIAGAKDIYIVAKDAAGNVSEVLIITIPVPTFEVGGTVKDSSSNPLSGALVKLMAGQTQIGITVTTDAYGAFTIVDVPNGTYNLVVSKDDIVVTSIITVNRSNYAAGTITLPAGNTNSVVEVKGSETSLPTINVEQTKGGEVAISTYKKTATITPDYGYVIGDVTVDGKSVGPVEEYTFEDSKNHTITGVFVKETALPYYIQNGEKIYIGFSVIAGKSYKYIAPENVTVEFRENPKIFKDNIIEWAKPHIDFVTERELFLGISQDIFSPNTSMTRAMFVTVLGRIYERSYGIVSGKSNFNDIDVNDYYAKYVEWANENGVIKGIGNNKFAPDENVTREQMAVIMLNFAKLLNKADVTENPLAYTDSASISAWAIDGAIYCQETNLIKGRNGVNFAPQENATRAEVAAVVDRLIKTIMK